MDSLIIVQILGVITLVLFTVAIQQRKKETLLILQAVGSLFFIAQYILTGRTTGAITFTIIAIRGFVFFLYKKKDLKPSLAVLLIFLSVLITSTVLTWHNFLSILPFIATAGKTWGSWQDNMKWIRITSMIAQCCMIVYDLSAAMYTGTLTEVVTLTSTTIAVWRYDIRKREAKTQLND